MADTSNPSSTVHVDAPIGRVTGSVVDGVRRFAGLRYAEPPVGPLRFRAPQSLTASGGTVDATKFGGMCHQQGAGADEIFPDLEVVGDEGEDCLFLNVYCPHDAPDGLPVLVWIHGGAFMNGAASMYDPSTIVADHDVVVVTVGYRLGVFGFLDLSRFGDQYAGSANRGIEDQIAALGWVADNIEAFGGDAGNVTIWGESAGAGSVMALLGAPAAEGLFHKAMAFSGGETLAPPADQLPGVALALGVESDDECLTALTSMASHELAQIQLLSGFYANPSIDGVVITRPSCEAIIDGGAASVPFLSGTTRDEGTFLAPLYDLGDEIVTAVVFGLAASIGRDDGAAYREFLDREIGLDQPLACLERAWFDCFRASAVRVAATATIQGAGGWVYDFEVETDHPLGVTHFADVPFTFNWLRTGRPREFTHPSTPENRALADSWSATIVEFARSGSPNGHGLPDWPRYHPDDHRTMRVQRRTEIAANPDGALVDVYRVPKV